MTESTTRAEERRALRDHFCDVLLAAAEDRDERPEPIETQHGPVPEWVIYEREQMLDAVNAARAERGLYPTGMGVIEEIERQAVGHADYVSKFALYCAEIVMDSSQ